MGLPCMMYHAEPDAEGLGMCGGVLGMGIVWYEWQSNGDTKDDRSYITKIKNQIE